MEYWQNVRDVKIKSILSRNFLNVLKSCYHLESCQISIIGCQQAQKSAKIVNFGNYNRILLIRLFIRIDMMVVPHCCSIE